MTNETPSRIAVALQYDGATAPTVTAKGSGDLAEQIIAIARAHGVPLMENAELLKFLALMELGEEIPTELYLTIAEIIAFAYWLKGKAPPRRQRDSAGVDTPLLGYEADKNRDA